MPSRRVHPWEQAYRDRIAAGLEPCRHCGALPPRKLYVVRIRPEGRLTQINATILCSRHRDQYNDPGGGPAKWRANLRSIAGEEALRPPDERWAERASEASRAEKGVEMARCSLCGTNQRIGREGTARAGRFPVHLMRNGVDRCAGSLQLPEFAAERAAAEQQEGVIHPE